MLVGIVEMEIMVEIDVRDRLIIITGVGEIINAIKIGNNIPNSKTVSNRAVKIDATFFKLTQSRETRYPLRMRNQPWGTAATTTEITRTGESGSLSYLFVQFVL